MWFLFSRALLEGVSSSMHWDNFLSPLFFLTTTHSVTILTNYFTFKYWKFYCIVNGPHCSVPMVT